MCTGVLSPVTPSADQKIQILEYNAASMPDETSQYSASNTHIPPPSLFIRYPCSCSLLQLDEFMLPSRHDRWLKPRPNNKWQDLENQRYVDLSRFDDEFVDEEFETSDKGGNEGNDNFNEIPRGDGSKRRSEDEAHHGPYIACSDPNRLGAMNEEALSTDTSPGSQLRCQHMQAPEQETPNDVLGPMEQEDDAITQFLEGMDDQDLHRDSATRLKSFFKSATLEGLEECSMASIGSRILLEDRNYSDKTFRPYPRPLTPKNLYDALRRQVCKSDCSGFFLD